MSTRYQGAIVHVDLGVRKVGKELIPEAVLRKFIGGKGLGAYLLHRHLAAHTDPYAPENVLIFNTGPLTGTRFPTSSRSAVITRSPLTGTFLDSYAGGFFGPHLRMMGVEAVIISGKADEPVFVLIEPDHVSIHDAKFVWGLGTSETEIRLNEHLGRDRSGRLSVAAIGQAGERMVRIANIINDRRAYGRGGAGAVMGSKNLKAVVIRGEGEVALDDEAGFKKIVKRARESITLNPMTKPGGVFPRTGTMMTVDLTHETGTLPTRNWQQNSFEHKDRINTAAFEKFIKRPRACFACPIGCSRDSVATWKGKEYVTEGPEYETIYAFGSNCEIGEPEAIIAADRICDEYGLDTISCGGVIGFAMECRERGLLPHELSIGTDLSFGNADALLDLIEKVALKEGIGELLAEGVQLAAERIPGSKAFAMHVKGMELPGYDPRGMKGQALTYALSDRGGCHLRSNTIRTELLGKPEPIDRYAYGGKAAMVRQLQMAYAAWDCLIVCLFGAFALSMEDYCEAVSTATGWEIQLQDMSEIARRAWNMTRMFNAREGFTRKDDTLPERLFAEPSTMGPSKGQIIDKASFHQMLDEYYALAGWDRETGIPETDSADERNSPV